MNVVLANLGRLHYFSISLSAGEVLEGLEQT